MEQWRARVVWKEGGKIWLAFLRLFTFRWPVTATTTNCCGCCTIHPLSLSAPPRCSPQVKWQRQLASVEQNSLHNLNNIRRYSEISFAGFIYKCGMLKMSGDIEASVVWVVARVVRATFRHDSFAGHQFGPPFSRRINELVKQVANSNSHRILIALSGGGDIWTWCAWTSTRVAA